jgi:tRNA(fMet)-specific endonuclease VapC
MTTPAYVLDANVLSDILRKNELILSRLKHAVEQDARFLLCPVVFYEVYRGLLHKQASRQVMMLRELTANFENDELTRADWDEAAQRWARLRQQGQQIADADLLIAVYADRRDAVVVTNNLRHFRQLTVAVENWRQ